MGGKTPTKQPRRGAVKDAGGGSKGMVGGGETGGKGEGDGYQGKDRRRRTEEAGAAVEALMKADPPLIQEAWYRLQGWYKAAVDRALPPA